MSNIDQLKRDALAAHKCGDFGALFESLTADEREAARLPQWSTIVWVNGVSVKQLYRGLTAADVLQEIATGIESDECTADRAVDRVAVSIERVMK